jgi:hypothetical protein
MYVLRGTEGNHIECQYRYSVPWPRFELCISHESTATTNSASVLTQKSTNTSIPLTVPQRNARVPQASPTTGNTSDYGMKHRNLCLCVPSSRMETATANADGGKCLLLAFLINTSLDLCVSPYKLILGHKERVDYNHFMANGTTIPTHG